MRSPNSVRHTPPITNWVLWTDQVPKTVEETGDDTDSYPEGGLKAWSIVLGAWCAMIPSMGLLNTLAVLQAWISTEELPGMPESTIGWIFSVYAFFLYSFGAQTGKTSLYPFDDACKGQLTGD